MLPLDPEQEEAGRIFALMTRSQCDSFEAAGFTKGEAFELTKTWVHAMTSDTEAY